MKDRQGIEDNGGFRGGGALQTDGVVIRERWGVRRSQADGGRGEPVGGRGPWRWDGGQGSAGQITSLRPLYIPKMMATPESLFPSGGDLDSSQLQMEPDEVDTLKEGEDPGTHGGRSSGRGA